MLMPHRLTTASTPFNALASNSPLSGSSALHRCSPGYDGRCAPPVIGGAQRGHQRRADQADEPAIAMTALATAPFLEP
ncbi:hypothetical protein I552_10115 [Mycobacterium xenopi 3993]|nr:hypothetical protein I552_10115 [Mycobacterium xenopi 3993]